MADVPRLLLLDNALDHDFYRPLQHWSAMLGFMPEQVHVPAGAPLPEPGEHSHVILSGCEGSIVEPPPWAEAELDWVRRAAELGVRMLGSCWGHQLIARALGGAHCVRRAEAPELGWIEVQLTVPDGPFAECFGTFSSHFDEVVSGSHPELRVLGRSNGCAVQAMRWGERPIWGVQAHPEIDLDTGRAFLTAGLERWPAHGAAFRAALAGTPRDDGFGQRLARRFLAS
jgi:GMP synthase-like glutamine amidotransferase